jgi:hypothetical protein
MLQIHHQSCTHFLLTDKSQNYLLTSHSSNKILGFFPSPTSTLRPPSSSSASAPALDFQGEVDLECEELSEDVLSAFLPPIDSYRCALFSRPLRDTCSTRPRAMEISRS